MIHMGQCEFEDYVFLHMIKLVYNHNSNDNLKYDVNGMSILHNN